MLVRNGVRPGCGVGGYTDMHVYMWLAELNMPDGKRPRRFE